MINLRCPEPSFFGRLVPVQGESPVFPDIQVVGSPYLDTVGVVRAVGIISVSVEQNVRVGKLHLALGSVCEDVHRRH